MNKTHILEAKLIWPELDKGFIFIHYREVLASSLILNVPERTNWKDCPTTKEEETAGAEKMRKHFQPFDFTDD